jgi:hypothetical protein
VNSRFIVGAFLGKKWLDLNGRFWLKTIYRSQLVLGFRENCA